MADTRRRRRNYEEAVKAMEETVEETVEVTIPEKPVKKTTPKAIPKKCIVNVPRLNFRKGPSTDTDIIGVLNMGEVLSIDNETGDFYAVTTETNDSGYVMKECVKI